MFEELIREIRRLEHGETLSVSLPEDDEGFLDRACPDQKCRAEFKVLSDDWRDKVSAAAAFCPLCRHQAPSQDWTTTAQLKYAKAIACRHIHRRIHGALQSGAILFNQRQRPGFITLSLSVKPGATPVFSPKAVGDVMRQRFTCEACGCRYSSIGAAYFCPACARNSVLTTFAQTITTVRATIGAIPAIRQAMAQDRDGAENTVRLLLEQSIGRLVGAFEHYTEALFASVPTASNAKVKRGSFQRLDEASALWRDAVARGYEDILQPQEMRELLLLVQRRHLLTHCDGIVDDNYLKKSGDAAYVLGQRITIRETDVLRLADSVEKIGKGLKAVVR